MPPRMIRGSVRYSDWFHPSLLRLVGTVCIESVPLAVTDTILYSPIALSARNGR